MALWIYAVLAILAVAAIGLIAKFVFNRTHGPEEITWKEYALAMLVNVMVIGPAVGAIGYNLGIRDQVTFKEHWNGWEARARVVSTTCVRDGSCRHTYDCDPYLVPVTYSCGDSENPRTCTRLETRYHSCPYVRTEHDYVVDTTLGAFTIDANRLPANPDAHRFRSNISVPSWVIEHAGTGEHPFWAAARERIESGEPGPVTMVKEYTNYVLASRSIMKRYGALADRYVEQKLMPALTGGITPGTFYRSQKTYQVGCPETDFASWNDSVERVNAALGGELHGDLRLVLVCDARVTNSDDYRFALEAYWQNVELFSKNALPKNSIVVIVGTTDGTTVAWGRAFTGMPVGNEMLATAVQTRLRASNAVAFTPDAVLGTIVPSIAVKDGTYVATSSKSGGVLTDVMWGISSPDTAFSRVSMGAKGEDDEGGGFSYLMSDVELAPAHLWGIAIAVFLLSTIAFVLIAFHDRIRDHMRGY